MTTPPDQTVENRVEGNHKRKDSEKAPPYSFGDQYEAFEEYEAKERISFSPKNEKIGEENADSELIPSEEGNNFVTLETILGSLYKLRKKIPQPQLGNALARNILTTTTTTTPPPLEEIQVTNLLRMFASLIFSRNTYLVFRYQPEKTVQLIHFLVNIRGAFTYRTIEVVGNLGIFANRMELFRVAENLKHSGLLKIYKYKPSKGRAFNLYSATWAAEQDIREAIDDHMKNLEKEVLEPQIREATISKVQTSSEKEERKRGRWRWTIQDRIRRAEEMLADPNTSEANRERAEAFLKKHQRELEEN